MGADVAQVQSRALCKRSRAARQRMRSARASARGPSEAETALRRREALGAGVGASLVPKVSLAEDEESKKLPTSPKEKNAQRNQVRDAMVSLLKERVSELDANNVLQLFWCDVASYDRASGTGGANGSVFLELNRPEVSTLRLTAETVLDLKREAEDRCENPNGISSGDFLAFTARFAGKRAFDNTIANNSGDPRYINVASNAWPLPMLGRPTAVEADAEGLVPTALNAGVDEFKAAASRLGLSKKELCVLTICYSKDEEAAKDVLRRDSKLASIIEDIDRARGTTTQTSYQKPFAGAINRLANNCATFDSQLYLYPQ